MDIRKGIEERTIGWRILLRRDAFYLVEVAIPNLAPSYSFSQWGSHAQPAALLQPNPSFEQSAADPFVIP